MAMVEGSLAHASLGLLRSLDRMAERIIQMEMDSPAAFKGKPIALLPSQGLPFVDAGRSHCWST